MANNQGDGPNKEPELDVAVFRFTLGIPGVEDALLPRVLGCLVGALLIGNHLVTPGPIADAQLRSEALGGVLAVLACFVPYFSRRLQEARGGRRKNAAATAAATRQVFALDPALSVATKQQLAWTTYSLLKNTRTKTVLISDGQRALCVRGSVAEPTPQTSSLDALTDTLIRTASPLEILTDALIRTRAEEVFREKRYLPDKGALSSAGIDSWSFVSTDISAALLQPVPSPGTGFMLLLSDENRFLSSKERVLVEGLASRLFANDELLESAHQTESTDAQRPAPA